MLGHRRQVLLLLMLTCLACSLDTVSGLMSDIVEQCCSLGREWYTQSHSHCGIYTNPLLGIPQQDHMSCSSVIQVCCLAERQKNKCSSGVQYAKLRDNCEGLHVQTGSEDARECCNCCKLGLVARQQGLQCDLFSQFGTQCATTFRECCSGSLDGPTTESPPPVTTPPVPIDIEGIRGGSDSLGIVQRPEGMCQQFYGELCAHTCIATPGSYYCQCREGYVLNNDGISCSQNDAIGRCATNSPCQHQCVDTGLAVQCKCFNGFMLQSDGRKCIDIDECSENTHTCQSTQRCINAEGGYLCEGPVHPQTPPPEQCPSGYAYSRLTFECEDIDECTINRHDCLPYQDCINTQGSFECRDFYDGTDEVEGDEPVEVVRGRDCAQGFVYNPITGLCETRSLAGGGGDGGDDGGDDTGDERRGRNCGEGFVFNRITDICEDIDECLTDSHTCTGPNQVCRNTYGAFVCSCRLGYRYNQATQTCDDVNECALGQATCTQGQTCENTEGSYHCRRITSCGTGYTLDTLTQQCVDDDECELGTHNCGIVRECRNTLGSFRCEAKTCPHGYRLNYRTGQCDQVNCPRGFKPDRSGVCVDINECTERPTACRPTQECRNTVGSYRCRNLVTCAPGMELNSAGTACQDIDECAQGTHKCTGHLMQCVNRPGTYICRCPEGYQLEHEQRTCVDVNECDRFGGQVCSTNAECQNTPGSFRCLCNEGFQSHGDHGRSCRDVDECDRKGMCQHHCRNTWGSFQCICNKGYKLGEDKRSCIDRDECEELSGQGRLCNGICQNTQGSYTCTCPSGYRLLVDGRTCVDLDECGQSSHTCTGPNDICINTRGSYKCESITCPKGFVRAARSSNNRNNNVRCQRRSFVCPQGDTECLYAPLSYTMNFLPLPDQIPVPADLFTMRAPFQPYRRMEFELKLISAEPRGGTDVTPASRDMFHLNQTKDNEAVIQLKQRIQGPQDVELQLDMNIYSKEFETQDEIFFGTAVARITLFITKDPWDQ